MAVSTGKTGVAILALVAAVVVATSWLVLNPDRQLVTTDASSTAALHQNARSPGPSLLDPTGPQGAVGPANGDLHLVEPRSPSGTPLATVLVRDDRGAPVANATCRVGRLPDTDMSGLHMWGVGDRQLPHKGIQEKQTNSAGVATFAQTDELGGSDPLCAWVTAEGFLANWGVLEPGTGNTGRQLTVSLTVGGPLLLAVLGGAGQAVADAEVFVVGMDATPVRHPASREFRAIRAWSFRGLTDASGLLRVPRVPGAVAAWASRGEEASKPLLGIQPTEKKITLVLCSTFFARGHVEALGKERLDRDLQVNATAQLDGQTVRLAQASVGEDGQVAQFRVPILPAEYYEFTLRGPGIVPDVRRQQPPEPGQQVSLEFVASRGRDLLVAVVDEQEMPLGGATIRVLWDSHGGGGQVGVTDVEGSVRVRGLRDTILTIDATAPGFVGSRYTNLRLDELGDEGVELQLHRGGQVRGQVVLAGKPAKEFEVVYWTPAAPQRSVTTEFARVDEGVFQLEGVPLGEVLLYASVRGHPRSSVESVHVAPDVLAELTCVIPDALEGTGVVLDGLTRTPIPGARIELWNSYRAAYLTPTGQGANTDSDGRFRLSGFGPGESRFVIRATGFAQYLGQAQGVAGETIDCGVIALQPTGTLSVRLDAPPVVDPQRCRANADGNLPFPMKELDGSGLVQWEGAGPGMTFVRLFLPDETQLFREEFLRPGGSWELGFSLEADRSMEVSLTDSLGKPLLPNATCTARFSQGRMGHNGVTQVAPFGEGGRARFNWVSSATGYLEVVDEAGRRLGARPVSLAQGVNMIDVVTGGTQVRVSVEDPEGNPVGGAALDARMEAAGLPWFQLASTDAQGIHTFTGLGMKRVFISAQHGQFGAKSDVEVDLERWNSEDTLEIVLDPRATILVRLLDGKDPLPAANLRFLGPQTHHMLGVFSTDAQGIAKYGPVCGGTYLVSVEQPGVWLTEQLVEATETSQPVDIQVRRLGELALQLTSSSQQPLEGISIDLESSETGSKLS